MYLCELSGRQGLGRETGEGVCDGQADCRLDSGDGDFGGEGRYVFPELFQLGQHIVRNQVGARADDLTEFDKCWPEFFQRESNALCSREWRLRPPPFEKNSTAPAEVAPQVKSLNEVSESVVKQNADNLPHSTEVSDKSKRS